MSLIVIGLAAFLLFVQDVQAQSFEILNPKVEQGDTLIIRINPQWQGPGVGVLARGDNYLPNKFGYVYVGVNVNAAPAKYNVFLTEYGHIRIDVLPTEFEVLKKSFPERRIHKKLIPVNSRIRASESKAMADAYARGDSWADYTDKGYDPPLNEIFITDVFGEKRIYTNAESRHGGVDLRASRGTLVRAVNSGVVLLSADRFSLEGNMVILDHGSGIFSLYLHLSKINVKQGAKVKKGEVIGLAGATGDARGPHLHFMVKVHGTNVDPLGFIDIMNQYLK